VVGEVSEKDVTQAEGGRHGAMGGRLGCASMGIKGAHGRRRALGLGLSSGGERVA
jgi:hypothetical protein